MARNIGILVGLAILVVVGVFIFRPKTEPLAPKAEEHAKDDHADDAPKRVTLTQAAFATAQIQVEAVKVGSAALASPGLEVPAQIEFDPRRIAVVSPRVDGRIEQLSVVEGDRVRQGQVVALLNSKDYLVAQSDVQQAVRRAKLLSAGPDSAGAQALVDAARRRLALLGVPASEIARVEAGGEPGLFLPVLAPIDGSVMKGHLLAGQAVHAGDPIFTIADLSVVDVTAEVPEQSLSMVRVGQAAQVRVAAFPSTPFAGNVERLREELNPETRTVRAVIHVANSNGQLRPGMFASVRLSVPSSAFPEVRQGGSASAETVLTIPESAVVTDGDKRYVFVQVAPLAYERREVQIAPLAPPGSSVVNTAFVLVRGGLKAGEMIVTRGAFTLKSELAKAGLGEHGH
jgi:multidrug efflux pump subunit AcrA (membrane-fusion protein)